MVLLLLYKPHTQGFQEFNWASSSKALSISNPYLYAIYQPQGTFQILLMKSTHSTLMSKDTKSTGINIRRNASSVRD